MSTTLVYEVMNPELFAVAPEQPAGSLAAELRERGLTSAPVVDRSGYPLGLISLRDLLSLDDDDAVATHMSAPAIVVEAGVPVEAAADLLARANLHRAVVVDELGRAIGIVSALDVIRGLIGQPAIHPWPFPLRNRDGGLAWSEPAAFEPAKVAALAPSAPGVFLLSRDGGDRPATVVWVESAPDLRERMLAVLSSPESPLQRQLIDRFDLSFRCVETPYRAARDAALRNRGT